MAIEKKTVSVKKYRLLKEVPENEKCPPQAKLILDTIKKHGDENVIEYSQLIKLISRTPEEGGLTTRQEPARIFGFYRPMMKKNGYIEEIEGTAEIEVEVPDKPAAADPSTQAAPAEAGAAPAAEAAPPSVKGKKGKQTEVAA